MSAVSVVSYETIKNAAQNNAAEIEAMYKTIEVNKDRLSPKITKLAEEILKDRKYSDPFYALVSGSVKGEYKDNRRSSRPYKCLYLPGDYRAFRWHMGRAIVEFLEDEPTMTVRACAKGLEISEWTCRRMKKFYLTQGKWQKSSVTATPDLEEKTVLQIIDQFKSLLIKELQQYKAEIMTLKNANAKLRNELEKHKKFVETTQQLITNLRNELNLEEKDKKESA